MSVHNFRGKTTKMSKDLIEELRATFDYHEDGYLIRKKNGKPCGERANHRDGYALVNVGGRLLLAHRIIYAIVTGNIPAGVIDHVDGNPMNNRIENLRDVSQSENLHNRKMNKDNSSGFQGVYWHAQCQKWMAKIRVNNRLIHLGLFDDINDAVEARKMAKIRYHPTSPEVAKFNSESIRSVIYE